MIVCNCIECMIRVSVKHVVLLYVFATNELMLLVCFNNNWLVHWIAEDSWQKIFDTTENYITAGVWRIESINPTFFWSHCCNWVVFNTGNYWNCKSKSVCLWYLIFDVVALYQEYHIEYKLELKVASLTFSKFLTLYEMLAIYYDRMFIRKEFITKSYCLIVIVSECIMELELFDDLLYVVYHLIVSINYVIHLVNIFGYITDNVFLRRCRRKSSILLV